SRVHVVAYQGGGVPVLSREQPTGTVERPRGDVGLNIDAAREDDNAGSVDNPAAFDLRDTAAVRDADVADFAVDVIGRVVDFAAGGAKHGIQLASAYHAGFRAAASQRRRLTSSPVADRACTAGPR